MACPKGGEHAWARTFEVIDAPGTRVCVNYYDVCTKCGRTRGRVEARKQAERACQAHARDAAILATRGVEVTRGWVSGYDQLARGHGAWRVNLEGSS